MMRIYYINIILLYNVIEMSSVCSQSPYPRRTFDLNKINQDRIIMSIRADDTTNIGSLGSASITSSAETSYIWRGNRRSQNENICCLLEEECELVEHSELQHRQYLYVYCFISKEKKDCFYSKNIKTEFHFHPPNAPLSNPFFSQNIFLKFKVGIVSLSFLFLLLL